MRRTRFGSRLSSDRRSPTTMPSRGILAALFYPLKLIVHVGLLGVAFVSFAPLLANRIPPLATFETLLPQVVFASLPLALLALFFRPRWLAVLGVVAFGWSIGTVWPYLPWHTPDDAPVSGAVADAKTGIDKTAHIKVVSINLWYRNDGYDAAIRYLENEDADVVGLIEITPQWLTALQPLYAKYPYHTDCMASLPPCEVMLLSKHPFTQSYAGRIEGRSPTVVWGEMTLAARPVVFAVTHLAWPLRADVDPEQLSLGGTQPVLPDTYPLDQARQAANLAQYLQGLGPDLVLMGDFNSVPWSRTLRALRAATGLEDEGPMITTWPAWQPAWNRIPIDHIMTRGAVKRLDFRHGFYVGSDHLPVEADIAIIPE